MNTRKLQLNFLAKGFLFQISITWSHYRGIGYRQNASIFPRKGSEQPPPPQEKKIQEIRSA